MKNIVINDRKYDAHLLPVLGAIVVVKCHIQYFFFFAIEFICYW